MNYGEAKEMAAEFQLTGEFSRVEIDHFGFVASRNAENENDGFWFVNLWNINPKSGNRNLTMVRDYDMKMVKAYVRKALGKATAKDAAAFARMAAEREVNRD